MRVRPLRLLISTLAVFLVAACTTTSEGTPLPADSSESGSSSEDPTGEPPAGDEVPEVEDPLDISHFFNDPCRALTPEQAQELNVPPRGVVTDGPLGKICNWSNPETRGATGIRMYDKHRVGLSAEYAANEQGEYAYFEEIPSIEGFPAVASDITDERDSGICVLTVGVANDLTFAVTLRLSTDNVGKKEPCEVAAMVAGMMLRTMKGES